MSWRALALLFVCGCGTGGASAAAFSGDPLATMTTAAGLDVKVWSSPQPPARGLLAMKFEFPQHEGEALSAEVTPFMPAMGHGTAKITTDSELVAEGLNLYMPGTWELRTQLSGAITDSFIVELAIP